MNLRSIFPRASEAFIKANSSLSPAQPKPDKAKPLGSTVPGKEESLGRPTVCFRGYSVRPLDPDGFAGSIKDLLDGLWRCGCIHGDAPWQVILVTEQEQVSTFAEERIEITISYPP